MHSGTRCIVGRNTLEKELLKGLLSAQSRTRGEMPKCWRGYGLTSYSSFAMVAKGCGDVGKGLSLVSSGTDLVLRF